MALQHVLAEPIVISGWVNGNLYMPTKEIIGILPIPAETRLLSGMAEYVTPLADSKHRKYQYLAAMQGTRKAVLPVHSPSERKLFHKLTSHDSFSPRNGEPRWRDAVRIWNAEAIESDDISYKVRIFCIVHLLF